jgi:TorA maturation chaperone TorD
MEYPKVRANMYEILKTAFSSPDEVLARSIVDGSFADGIHQTVEHCCSLAGWCCMPPDLMEEVKSLSVALIKESDRMDYTEILNAEFTRLFVNDFPTLWAPPYESYYREGRMMGEAAIDCLAIYRADDLVLTHQGDPPDHIVTQLEYLHYLCIAEIMAMEESNQLLIKDLHRRKHRFYEHHMMRWVPEFCGRIRSHSGVAFYRAMSRLLKNFMILENRSLNVENVDLLEEVGDNEVSNA